MAKIKYTGVPIPKNMIPGYTIYLTKKGYWQTRKIADITDKIKTAPSFERMRQNNTEFGQAAKAAKLVKQAFHEQIKDMSTSETFNRLIKTLLKAIKGDKSHERGQRTLLNGNLELLNRFEFNDDHQDGSPLSARFETRKTNTTVKVKFASFNPSNCLKAPKNVAYFRIFTANAMINLRQLTYAVDGKTTEWLKTGHTMTREVELTCKQASGEDYLNVLALGIEFRRNRTSFAIIKAWPVKLQTLKT